MADPRGLTPEALEILVTRDLRKAGLQLARVRRRGLEREDDHTGDYRLDLEAELSGPSLRLRIEAQRRSDPMDAADVRAAAARLRQEERLLVVSTAGFTRDALTAAADAGITLLRASDARAAFDGSGWGPAGHYPMWLPEHVLELAGRGPSGAAVYRMLDGESGASLLAESGPAGG